jgi:hypothetical protein
MVGQQAEALLVESMLAMEMGALAQDIALTNRAGKADPCTCRLAVDSCIGL